MPDPGWRPAASPCKTSSYTSPRQKTPCLKGSGGCWSSPRIFHEPDRALRALFIVETG